MSARRVLGLLLVVGVVVVNGRPAARALSVVDLLDRYRAGDFDAVVSTLDGDINFQELLDQLKREAPAWMDAGGPADRSRRELTAATFALEAARADEWHEWKWVQRQPPMCPPPPPPGGQASKAGCFQPLNVLYWKPPPLLIEWGCKLMSHAETPRPIERWWQLAALAVAQRSEDVAFLVGDPAIGQGIGAGEIINQQDEIKHLDHVQKRFPTEMRFVLAQGIARDRMWQNDAIQAYLSVIEDPDTGGEAAMRLGAMSMRAGRREQASVMLDRAEKLTRDPYVIYLARYFKGQLADRENDHEKAQSAYRGAVAAWPRGQAATMSLAASLFREGKRAEAQELTGWMLDAVPPLFDPWREYVHADNRFWPYLIGRLRAEIAK